MTLSMFLPIELSLIKVKVYKYDQSISFMSEVEVQIMRIRLVQIIKMKSRLRTLLPDTSEFNYTSLATGSRGHLEKRYSISRLS